jgi:hypothetical protein
MYDIGHLCLIDRTEEVFILYLMMEGESGSNMSFNRKQGSEKVLCMCYKYYSLSHRPLHLLYRHFNVTKNCDCRHTKLEGFVFIIQFHSPEEKTKKSQTSQD